MVAGEAVDELERVLDGGQVERERHPGGAGVADATELVAVALDVVVGVDDRLVGVEHHEVEVVGPLAGGLLDLADGDGDVVEAAQLGGAGRGGHLGRAGHRHPALRRRRHPTAGELGVAAEPDRDGPRRSGKGAAGRGR